MSVVFLLRSEEQLSDGTPWCVVFGEALDAPIVPVVLGTDRRVLEKHVESVLADKLTRTNGEPTDVQTIDPATDHVLSFCQDVGCRLLVLIYAPGEADRQRELFESSPFPTVWLHAVTDPPIDEAHLFGGYVGHRILTERVCRKLLGMTPSAWAVDASAATETDSERQTATVNEQIDAFTFPSEAAVVFGVDSVGKDSLTYQAGRRLIERELQPSVMLVREGQSVVPSLLGRLRRWSDSVAPSLNRDERVALQQDLESGSKPNLEFLGMISASSMLASFGLLQNSAAVIIGAMLIAPLMTPILGAGLAIAIGNRPLFRDAFTSIVLGFAGALLTSGLFGTLVWAVDQPDWSPEHATEMWARCNPSVIDFCVGLVGGMAAAYARTRSHLSSALAGAAIAAALVPPLSTAGLQMAFGLWEPVPAGIPVWGPLLVVSINVLTIMVGSSLVLWLRGIRAHSGGIRPQDRWAIRVVILLVALMLLVLVGLV